MSEKENRLKGRMPEGHVLTYSIKWRRKTTYEYKDPRLRKAISEMSSKEKRLEVRVPEGHVSSYIMTRRRQHYNATALAYTMLHGRYLKKKSARRAACPKGMSRPAAWQDEDKITVRRFSPTQCCIGDVLKRNAPEGSHARRACLDLQHDKTKITLQCKDYTRQHRKCLNVPETTRPGIPVTTRPGARSQRSWASWLRSCTSIPPPHSWGMTDSRRAWFSLQHDKTKTTLGCKIPGLRKTT